jgi:hypothetical protein
MHFFLSAVPPIFIGNPLNVRPEEFATYSYERFEKFVRDIVAPSSVFGDNAITAQELILHHYIHSEGDRTNSTFLLEKYTEVSFQLISQSSRTYWQLFFSFWATTCSLSPVIKRLNWNVPTNGRHGSIHTIISIQVLFRKTIRLKVLIQIRYCSFLVEFSIISGSYHTMELPYIFGMIIMGKYDYNEKDYIMIDLLATVLTNFAKYGLVVSGTPKFSFDLTFQQSNSDSCSWCRLGTVDRCATGAVHKSATDTNDASCLPKRHGGILDWIDPEISRTAVH